MLQRIPAIRLAIAFAALVATGSGCPRGAEPAAPATPPAGHDEHATQALALNNGARWATDAPLREGMRRIRGAVAHARAQGGFTPEAAAALAKSVRGDVAFLVANCKLEPRADATLHVLIGEMLGGAAALERDPASSVGMSQVLEALREYPNYFDHAGWVPIEAARG